MSSLETRIFHIYKTQQRTTEDIIYIKTLQTAGWYKTHVIHQLRYAVYETMKRNKHPKEL